MTVCYCHWLFLETIVSISSCELFSFGLGFFNMYSKYALNAIIKEVSKPPQICWVNTKNTHITLPLPYCWWSTCHKKTHPLSSNVQHKSFLQLVTQGISLLDSILIQSCYRSTLNLVSFCFPLNINFHTSSNVNRKERHVSQQESSSSKSQQINKSTVYKYNCPCTFQPYMHIWRSHMMVKSQSQISVWYITKEHHLSRAEYRFRM